jgi:hypothetical protein
MNNNSAAKSPMHVYQVLLSVMAPPRKSCIFSVAPTYKSIKLQCVNEYGQNTQDPSQKKKFGGERASKADAAAVIYWL